MPNVISPKKIVFVSPLLPKLVGGFFFNSTAHLPDFRDIRHNF